MPRVTQKGQVTIPREIRANMDINTGDEILFEVEKGKVFLKKKPARFRNLKKYVGYLSHLKGKASDEILDELRGEFDD